MDLAPRHAGCRTDHPTPISGTGSGSGVSQDHQPMERIHKMKWSNRNEREDAAKHLHTKLLQVEKMYQQCHQARQELQQEKQVQGSLAKSSLSRASSSGPLPLKAKLALILDGINEIKKQEFDGVFGWKGEATVTQSVSSNEAAVYSALQECEAMEARIMAYERVILRDEVHSDEVHHISGEKDISVGDQKEMDM